MGIRCRCLSIRETKMLNIAMNPNRIHRCHNQQGWALWSFHGITTEERESLRRLCVNCHNLGTPKQTVYPTVHPEAPTSPDPNKFGCIRGSWTYLFFHASFTFVSSVFVYDIPSVEVLRSKSWEKQSKARYALLNEVPYPLQKVW